jgi:hypothetical protein
MSRYGCYANRGAKHRGRQAALFAAARNDGEQLRAAFDWFRSSAQLLARRRVPEGMSQTVHEERAARMTYAAARYLKDLAEAIDRGDYDAERVTRRDGR